MAKVLVAYATRSGASEDIARAIADVVRKDGHDVAVADLRDRPAPDADLVIVGSGVNAGAWYPEAIGWLARNTAALKATKVAVFNACLNAADPAKRADALAYNKVVVERMGTVASESFPGRFAPARVGWFRRTFLRAIQQEPEDHLDLAVVRGWAGSLLREL